MPITEDTAPPRAAVSNWERISAPVRPFLDEVTRTLEAEADDFEPEISAFVRYALAGAGKQLRPMLVAFGGGVAGGVAKPQVTGAVVIEMVHLATLVHDDVMDEASLRRRRPTLAANWGNEIAVLAGDCLFARALQRSAEFPTTDICRAISQAAGTVCTGEILQTLRRGNFTISKEEYLKVVGMKTAELFALAAELGGQLNNAPKEHLAALREYGLRLGTAYQIYDDCVDVFGSEPRAGKSLGTDLVTGKATLPVLAALELLPKTKAASLREWLSDWRSERMDDLRDCLVDAGALEEARRVLDSYLDAARAQALILPDCDSRQHMLDMVECVDRQADALAGRV